MALPPASVWMDAQATQGSGSGERGLGRHVVELIRALLKVAPDSLGSVRLDPALPAPTALESLQGSGLVGRGLARPRPGEPVPSIYHVPAPFEEVGIDRIWPEWIRTAVHPVRTVVTLHDLVPLALSDMYLRDNLALKALYTARVGLIRHADQVLSISESTAADAVELLGVDPRRITLIESGVSDTFSSLVGSADEASEVLAGSYPEVRDGFLLYVGGGDPRKNMDGTIEGFARLPESLRHAHQLVVVCRLGPQVTGELRVKARRLGIADVDIFFAGFVPDRELAAMYRRCALFLFPSLYEGFGLPILEAMSCGAPVAAAANSSIPEVLGDLEGTFDAGDPGDIARTVARILTHPQELEALRERSHRRVARFTWERTAEKVLAGYEAALSRGAPRGRVPRARARIALVTPWPPERSLAASSGEHLASALSEHADVDVVAAAGERGSDRSADGRVRFWGLDELSWLPELRSQDGCVYVLDADPAHAGVLESLRRRPGTVLLHDAGSAPGVAEHAERIIVHSRAQLDTLRRELGDGGPPSVLVPAPIPAPPPTVNGFAAPAGSPLVVCAGRLDVVGKRLDLLVEAFAQLAARHPEARLAFIGDAPGSERDALARLASGAGVASRIEVRGPTAAREYWGTLRAADVAVQLRAGPASGIVSGPVCDAIAARTPTIVSDLGWFRDLPDQVVTRVPEDCSPSELADRISGLTEAGAVAAARSAQDRYAAENSYRHLAKRLAAVIGA
jgi:glycosyltransferase involved in cell wall biosynthesis